jgi:small subunit ribosomal protein S16
LVKIRLKRAGRKKLPVYQIVVADARSPRDGKFLEVVGTYQPTAKPHAVTIKKDRIVYWMQTGAQPTSTVRSLIQKTGLLYELRLKKLGRSDAEIAEAMEQWQERQAERRQKRLNVKSRRRQLKKEAEGRPAVAEEVAVPVVAAPVAEAPAAEAPVVEAPAAEAPVVEAPAAEAPVAEVAVAAAPEVQAGAAPEAPVAAAEEAPETKAEEKEEGGEA